MTKTYEKTEENKLREITHGTAEFDPRQLRDIIAGLREQKRNVVASLDAQIADYQAQLDAAKSLGIDVV